MVNKLTYLEILGVFRTKPKEELHLADISRESGIPHPTARLWLNTLEKKGVLRKRTKGRLTLYSINLSNPNIIDYLSIVEKDKLIKECENSLILKEIKDFFNDHDCHAIIFGSSAVDITKANDIDILIVGSIEEKRLKVLSQKLNKVFHVIKVSNLKKISKSFKNEVLKKHIFLTISDNLMGWLIS